MPRSFHLRPVTQQDAHPLYHSWEATRPMPIIEQLIIRAKNNELRHRGIGIVAVKHDPSTRDNHGENTVVGFGQIARWSDCAEISDLIIAPPYRGQGIGTAIINYLIDYAKLNHFSRIEIGVSLENPRALALYRRLKFIDHYTRDFTASQDPQVIRYLNMNLLESSTRAPNPPQIASD